MKLIEVDSKATLEDFLTSKKRLNLCRFYGNVLCNMFIGIMKIHIWSYLYKNITNPEKNMLNK
jgi:hypothetical protein